MTRMKTQPATDRFLRLVIGLALFATALWLISANVQVGKAPRTAITPTTQDTSIPISLVINNGTAHRTFQGHFAQGTSALDIFKRFAVLEVKDYGPPGVYLLGVDGLRENQGGNGYFWQYYVDGVYGKVGVSQYRLEKPVSLELRYEIPGPEAYQ